MSGLKPEQNNESQRDLADFFRKTSLEICLDFRMYSLGIRKALVFKPRNDIFKNSCTIKNIYDVGVLPVFLAKLLGLFNVVLIQKLIEKIIVQTSASCFESQFYLF